MSGLYINAWVAVGSGALMVLFMVLGHRSKRSNHYNMWDSAWVLLAAIAGVVLFIAGLILVINEGTYAVDRTACREFSEAADRDTRFARYTYWSWDCLVETDEGWVSTEQIVKMDD